MRDGNVLAHMEDDIWISGSNLERVRQMGMATSDEDMIYLLAFVLFCCSSFSLRVVFCLRLQRKAVELRERRC
ncbi:hypothetical protein M440DRAFT_1180876 [Trichoderma longibrachiatum ATCC 18648]|uniref:Uncharacterized protein n=1 Tax=Trichoderma longibrachiatum ATCC 18648 TaxID=983965 RepID=A0A2T4CE19_TRILO|nr:hypothetical protein M440DRAFT_1180876 [Trichoderma longibrachiatum ATCC 18648]